MHQPNLNTGYQNLQTSNTFLMGQHMEVTQQMVQHMQDRDVVHHNVTSCEHGGMFSVDGCIKVSYGSTPALCTDGTVRLLDC